MLCPVCFQESPQGAPSCECGYLFTESTPEPAAAPSPLEAIPASADRTPSRFLIADALEAFCAEYIDQRLVVPANWARRMARLARETEESRRFATVLMADLVGFTAMTNQLAEEKRREVMDWFFATCRTLIERHGGFLIKTLGDAVLVGFGAPWAFERDSEQAVLCAVELRDAVQRRGRLHGYEPAISAGLASGVINVVMHDQGGRLLPDIEGPAVNLAARMQQAAGRNEILIPESLAQLVEPAFDLAEGRTLDPKNWGAAVNTRVVIGHRREGVERRHHEFGFVGRESELDLLGVGFQRAQSGGFCSVDLRGEAGVGKTRLVRRALSGIDSLRPFQIPLEPHHRHMVLQPCVLLLREVAAAAGCEEWEEEEILAALQRAAGPLSGAQRDALGLLLQLPAARKRLASLPTPYLRATVESSLLTFIVGLAATHPTVLVVDDFQWADPASVRLVSRVLEARPAGLMIILIGRDAEPGPGALPEERPADTPTLQADFKVTLPPLNSLQSRDLLEAILPLDLLHPLQRQRLLEEAGGVPLYLVELAMLLQPATSLEAEALAAEVLESRELDARKRLIEIFMARIDRLEARHRLVLQCGAVLGRRFRESVLAAYEDIRDHLMEELAFLKGVRLIGDELSPEDRTLFFTPPIIRDVAYQMLSAEQRRRLHIRFAELIEKRFAGRLDDFTLELCTHWLHGRVLGRALRYFRRACQVAIRFGNPEQAIYLGMLARQCAEERIETEGSTPILRQQLGLIAEQMGLAYRLAGDYEGSRRLFGEWLEVAREVGNDGWLFMAGYQVAIAWFESGNLPECERILHELAGSPARASRELNMAEELLAKIHLRKGRFREALETFLRVAEREATGSGSLEGDGWSNAAICLERLGRLAESEAALLNARAAYARYGSPFGECIALNNLGIIKEKAGEYEAAARLYKEGAGKADSCGFVHGLSALAANTSYLLYLQGDAAGAQEQAARALRAARLIRHGNSEIIALINMALADDAAGLPSIAAEHIAQAVELAQRLGDAEMLAEARLEEVWLGLRRRDVAAAQLAVSAIPSLEGENEARRIALRQACESLAADKPYACPDGLLSLELSHTTRLRIQMIENEFSPT